MKSRISATIEKELVNALNQIRKRERRTFSSVLETAVAEYVEKRRGSDDIVTSPGIFQGGFSRKEAYARAKK